MKSIFVAAFPVVPIGIGGAGLTPESIVNNIFTFLMWVVGVVGVVMIVYAGFMFIISAGRPDKTKLAIQSIIYTVSGFAVALLARSIVSLVMPVATSNTNIAGVASSGISLFMWVIGVTAIVMLIVSGLLYVISAGDPGKTKSAKDAILYAIIGLAVALLGGAIISFMSAQFK
jgi:hypothetical protein